MRRRVWGAVVAASTMVAWAQAPSVQAAPLYAFARPGATPDQVVADMQTCADRATHVPGSAGPVVGATLGGGLVAGTVIGIYEGSQRARAMAAASDLCMYGLGYTRLDLTPQEDAALRAARSPEAKQAWLRSFAAQDLSSRIAAAAPDQPRMLPQFTPEPFAFAGLRIDPASVKVVSGPTPNYHPLLSATASHRRVATLAQDVQAERPFHVTMAAGAPLYAVDGAGLASVAQTTLWCGPATSHVFGRDHAIGACLVNTEQGLALEPGGGFTWMMSPENVPSEVRPEPVTSGPADLTPADGDSIGPMDLSLEALAIEQDHVRLRISVARDGKTLPIWTGDVAFGADGRAVLPFWSKRLVLTRSYDKTDERYLVAPTLEDGGSGSGWLDAPAKVAHTGTTGASAGG